MLDCGVDLLVAQLAPDARLPRLARHGLRLLAGADDPRAGQLRGFASALGMIAGCETEVLLIGAGEVPDPWSGITLRLHDDEQRERKLRGLISLAERFGLSQAD